VTLSGLQSAVQSADAGPTPDYITGLAERRKLVATGLARWQEVLGALKAAGLPPLKTD
jgi:hypothetical protein